MPATIASPSLPPTARRRDSAPAPLPQPQDTPSDRLRSMRRSPPKRPRRVPAIDSAPGIFVGFAAAQEVKLAGPFANGGADRMRDALGTRAETRQVWIEAAKVSVGTPTINEAIIHRRDRIADA